jgi:hypothetical protein
MQPWTFGRQRLWGEISCHRHFKNILTSLLFLMSDHICWLYTFCCRLSTFFCRLSRTLPLVLFSPLDLYSWVFSWLLHSTLVSRLSYNPYAYPGLGKPHITHIDFFHEKRHMFVWGWGGGGGVVAVTFLCKHHGKIR